MAQFTRVQDAWRAIDAAPGGTERWTVEFHGERLGTRDAVITGVSIREKTAAERAEAQRTFTALANAYFASLTPALGGRS